MVSDHITAYMNIISRSFSLTCSLTSGPTLLIISDLPFLFTFLSLSKSSFSNSVPFRPDVIRIVFHKIFNISFLSFIKKD